MNEGYDNVSAHREGTVKCRCFFLLFFKTGQFVWQAGRQQAPMKRKHKSTSVYSLFKGAFSVWREETEGGDGTHSSLLLFQHSLCLFDISLVQFIFESLLYSEAAHWTGVHHDFMLFKKQKKQ